MLTDEEHPKFEILSNRLIIYQPIRPMKNVNMELRYVFFRLHENEKMYLTQK
jgi:hypothetical protein